MKILRLFVVLAALLFAGVAAPSPVRARDTVSFDFFYDSLAPYGEWIEVGDYGLCWRPTGVDPDWTPYSDGYWAFTDAGWTWVSYEEFGGIVYHYGRWIRLDDESWCWMPDYEWAPAWVSWRSSDDYVGWAPLPPEAHWRPEVGISVWVDRECDLGPGYYHFCRTRDFGAPVLRPVIINRWENATIIRHTVNVTNITYNTTYAGGPVIFNGGPSFTTIHRISARPVPALKLVQEANFDPARHRGANGRVAFNAQTVGNQLIVAAPQVMKPSDPAAFRARVKRVLPGDAVTRGWNMVKSPDAQKELRQEMGRQSKGLTPATAPARAVAATDLKVVPAKADPTATPPTATAGEHRDRTDRPGRGSRPDGVAVQPNRIPPTNTPPAPNAPTATPFVKPQAPVVTATPPAATPGEPAGVTRGRGRGRNDRNSPPPGAPTAVNPNLKPFNPEPGSRPPVNPPSTATITPAPRGQSTDDGGAKARAAEEGRIRAEQQQQKAEQLRMNQQRQAEGAAKQKQQADQATQQQKQMEQQKQISAQQEAARARAEEQRRREAFDQQRQQQKQQQMQIQQQQQQQQQQERAIDARKAQDAERAARDRARDQAIEAQRAQQMRKQPPQPQPQQNNQGGGQPRQGGGHSKDGKDKDKDKDKN